ncbi:MAG TPA: choice-of-anchor P family protein [Gaiellaceae bacterium]|nr:choice-of-anchor P family protein [Gaiellaceae bacterium]
MGKRVAYTVVLAGLLLLAAGSSGAGGARATAGASARAYAIRVVVPGQAGASVGTVSAPPDHIASGSSFAYPADGSIVTTGSVTASASTDAGSSAVASASSEVQSLIVFGGEIIASSVNGDARGSTKARSARGDFSGAGVAGLTVLGQAAAAGPNGRVALADWGYLITLEQGTDRSSGAGGAQGFHGFTTALDIHLTAPHGGLPAGSEIQVGYAEASVQASVAPPPKPIAPEAPSKRKAAKTPKAPEPTSRGRSQAPLLPVPPGLQPKLTAGGYVFPVYGPLVSFGDSYGAFRGDVAGNWHHGDDIFAPLGAPLLACADGIVFSVGWNDVGGNRLWLRDSQGNEFYYAHLSAFSPLAKNGRLVKAGEVVGFVGNTGDAQGTPPHLHFEVHPFSLLFMGYDGAVDPTSYLRAWQHLQDVRFLPNVAGWVPTVVTDPAPRPAAILLQVSDISEASGLDPGSLQRAMAARGARGAEGQLVRSLGFRPPRGVASAAGGP